MIYTVQLVKRYLFISGREILWNLLLCFPLVRLEINIKYQNHPWSVFCVSTNGYRIVIFNLKENRCSSFLSTWVLKRVCGERFQISPGIQRRWRWKPAIASHQKRNIAVYTFLNKWNAFHETTARRSWKKDAERAIVLKIGIWNSLTSECKHPSASNNSAIWCIEKPSNLPNFELPSSNNTNRVYW